MDGTLLDTESIGILAWIEAFGEHGILIDAATAALPIGHTMPQSQAIFKTALGVGPDYEIIQKRSLEIFGILAKRDGIPVKRGARRILSRLKSRGVSVGLATSTPREKALRQLDEVGLAEFFDAAVCGDDLAEHKPSPEVYREAVRRLGHVPSIEIWAVEDSANGIRSAHRAGLSVAFIPDIHSPDPEVESLATERHPHLDSLADRFGLGG